MRKLTAGLLPSTWPCPLNFLGFALKSFLSLLFRLSMLAHAQALGLKLVTNGKSSFSQCSLLSGIMRCYGRSAACRQVPQQAHVYWYL